MADIAADVIIVGSGVAGALLAAKLSAAGVKVAILEAGAVVNRGEALQRYWDAPIRVPERPYPPSPEADHPISNDPDYWYRQSGPDKFKSTYLKVVGGTTWHWLGTCLRFVPNDFRLGTAYGRGVDWPLGYDDLEPFYAEAENEIGVSGDSGESLGSPRSAPYPMPPIPQTFMDKAYARASRHRIGGSRDAASTQFCRSRREARLLRECQLHSDLSGPSEIRRDRARGGGGEERRRPPCTNYGDEGRNRRRRGVAAIRFKRWDGSEGIATGKVFVLAAHAIETPRLLLNSRSEAMPNGVANSSDQVGRKLMDHPAQLSWALAREPVWPYRGPLSTSGIETKRDGTFRKDSPAFRIEIGNDGWSWPKGAPTTTAADLAYRGLRGAELEDALRNQACRHLRLTSLLEQLPDTDNRVTLDPHENDIYGVPLPRLAYRLGAYIQAGLAAARAAHAQIFAALSATEIQHRDAAAGAGHIIGTARMGSDPAHSVVDRDLRSHDHRNLFILGSAVFPTSATANPTLTIAALSLRAVDHVKASLAT